MAIMCHLPLLVDDLVENIQGARDSSCQTPLFRFLFQAKSRIALFGYRCDLVRTDDLFNSSVLRRNSKNPPPPHTHPHTF